MATPVQVTQHTCIFKPRAAYVLRVKRHVPTHLGNPSCARVTPMHLVLAFCHTGPLVKYEHSPSELSEQWVSFRSSS